MTKKEESNSTTGTIERTIPAGYLSIEEIALKYPNYAKTVERAVDADLKPTLRVMVYINEPAPIKVRIFSKDSFEELENYKPISMYAMDVLRLTGDPSYRFDIGILPDHVNMLYDNYDALRRQVLENNLRNIKHAG